MDAQNPAAGRMALSDYGCEYADLIRKACLMGRAAIEANLPDENFASYLLQQ